MNIEVIASTMNILPILFHVFLHLYFCSILKQTVTFLL